jgi:hypothetical protein
MVDNLDAAFSSQKNRAFSVYSPLNTTLADSVYPGFTDMPLVAMGNGWGLNYGISRPGTFNDPRLLDNLILFNVGSDFQISEKISLSLDWWRLQCVERGIGTLNGSAIELSRNLGDEIDASLNYAVHKNVSLSLGAGYFFPGAYYKETRDDTSGSLLTPFVRGDGGKSGAYQVELSITLSC